MTFADDTSAVTIMLYDSDGNVIEESGTIVITGTASDEEIEEAQAAVDAAQAALDAKAYDNSSYGFFIWLSENESLSSGQRSEAATAAALLDGTYSGSLTASPRSTITYDDLLEALTIGEGTTTLENLLVAVEMVEYCNELRGDDDNFTSLSDYAISPVLMAISELQTSYNVNYDNHTKVFYIGENLAWGQSSVADAYYYWYTYEKSLYDAAGGSTSSTGHYENIVSTGYSITGAAYTDVSGLYSTTWGQVFQYASSTFGTTANAYTASEFEELVEEYKEQVDAVIEPLEEALEEAQKALAALQSYEVGTYTFENGTAALDEAFDSSASYTAEISSLSGHGSVSYELTLDSDGNISITLSDSDASSIFEHSYVATVKAATCTQQGYTTYTCSICGDSYKDDYTEATGHSYTRAVNVVWADDYSSVSFLIYCENCTSHLTRTYTSTKITYEDEVTSCTEGGTRTYTATYSFYYQKYNTVTITTAVELEATEHSYETVVTEPTCTEGGYTTYTCTVCGYSYTGDNTQATGHTAGEAVVENEIAATCTEEGSYESVIYCTVCGEELSRETVTVAALGHTAGAAVVENETAATCTEEGSYESVVYCTVCGEELSRETVTVPATGHTAGEAVAENEIAATCTEEGSYDSVVYCTVCNKELSRETVTVAALGHTESEAVAENEIAATCTEEGSYDSVVYCTVCGEELSRETVTVAATGHTAGAAVIENETAATCTEEGSYDSVVYCTVCGEELSRETVTVPATGHTAGAAVVENETEATCTEEGSYESVIYCTVCGEELSRETVTVPAAGHIYDEGVITKEAACTEEGEIVYTCIYGDDSYTEVIPAAGHTYEAGEFEWNNDCSAATLTFICSVCGDVQVIEAQITTQTTEPTCTQTGSIVRTAAVVFEGITYTDTQTATLDVIDHTPVSADNAVEATCGADGKEADIICAVCGEILEEGAVIPATGEHDYKGVVTKEATTTEEGEITYTCTVCGDSYTETIAMLEEETTTIPESTEETTTSPESTEETTTAPETQEETTTIPGTTEETTTIPESTEETTTSPETQEETTTSPESTEETTTAPETTEETTTSPESTGETTTAPETTEETTSPGTTEETTSPGTTEETATAPESTEETTAAPESTEETSSSGTGTEETSAEETTDALTDETGTETESSAGEEAQAETETEAAAADGETAEEAASDDETTEAAAEDEETSESPTTGDSNGFAIWACMGIIAAFALAFTALKRRFN